MPGSLQLLIQADDFGYSTERDNGIIDAFQKGRISGASLLVNGVSAKEAAAIANTRGMPLSLHLNLTEGDAITGVSSLTTSSGEFQGKHGTRIGLSTGKVQKRDLRKEVEAQLVRFKELTGYWPTRFDGHQHIHVHPDAVHVVCQVMRRANVQLTRIPLEPWRPCQDAGDTMPEFHSEVYKDAKAASRVYQSFGFQFPDYFMGMCTMGAEMSVQRATQVLRSIPIHSTQPTVCEWMVHPGNVTGAVGGCGRGPDEFSQSSERRHELDILTSKDILDSFSSNLLSAPNTAGGLEELRTTLGKKKNLEHHVLLLAPAGLATGNATTALRLQFILHSLGYTTSLIDPNFCTATSLRSFIEDQAASIVVGLHAFRAGKWLSPDSVSVPVVIVLGGTDVNCMLGNQHSQDSVHRRQVIQNALGAASRIVAFTPSMRHRAAQALIQANMLNAVERIVSVPQSIQQRIFDGDADAFTPFSFCKSIGLPQDAIIIAQPCGIRPVKDPCYSFNVMKRLRHVHSTVVLVLVGPVLDTVTESAVMALAKPHTQVGSNLPLVVYHPPIPHGQLLFALREEAALVLNTSISEGMCNAVMEAMAVGTPVVVRDNEGNRSLVEHKRTGWIFDDEQGLEQGIETLLSDKELRESVVQNARDFVQTNLDEKAEHAAYGSLLAEVLALIPPSEEQTVASPSEN